MAPLPYFNDQIQAHATSSQQKIYLAEHYGLFFLFLCLLVLCVINIWTIIVKQKRWQSLPLLNFYVMTFLAILMRTLLTILFWAPFTWVHIMGNL